MTTNTTPQDQNVSVIGKLIEEKLRMIDAGCKRGDPSTWRPDLVKSIDEYRKELGYG